MSDLDREILTKEEFIALLEKGCPDCGYQPAPGEKCYDHGENFTAFRCPKCGEGFRFTTLRTQ